MLLPQLAFLKAVTSGGLNSGLRACAASALPKEPHLPGSHVALCLTMCGLLLNSTRGGPELLILQTGEQILHSYSYAITTTE